MIAHSPKLILGTSSISVCDFIHSSSPYQNEVATRNYLDVSNSWSIKGDSRRIHTSSYIRREPVSDINRKLTMMRLVTKLGVQSLHAITKFADQVFGSTTPIFGNHTGEITYVHNITKENQNK
jgi:hypothetical protein